MLSGCVSLYLTLWLCSLSNENPWCPCGVQYSAPPLCNFLLFFPLLPLTLSRCHYVWSRRNKSSETYGAFHAATVNLHSRAAMCNVWWPKFLVSESCALFIKLIKMPYFTSNIYLCKHGWRHKYKAVSSRHICLVVPVRFLHVPQAQPLLPWPALAHSIHRKLHLTLQKLPNR